jgi:hypothetical protein
MPEISRFFGIVITMWFNDPPRARALVVEWAALHREELLDNWALLRARRPPHPVAPLE